MEIDPRSGAPWPYRQRALIYGLIYGGGFFFGYLISGAANLSVEPAFHAFGLEAWLAAAAIILAVMGFALRVWASSYLPAAIVYHPDVRTEALRVAGPYRFVRNPLYLGNVLQAIGVGLLGPWPVFVLVVAGVLLFSVYLISVEQRFLAAAHGEAYRRYTDRVPALVPLPAKSYPPVEQPFSVRGGFLAERYFGIISVAVIVLVIVRWK